MSEAPHCGGSKNAPTTSQGRDSRLPNICFLFLVPSQFPSLLTMALPKAGGGAARQGVPCKEKAEGIGRGRGSSAPILLGDRRQACAQQPQGTPSYAGGSGRRVRAGTQPPGACPLPALPRTAQADPSHFRCSWQQARHRDRPAAITAAEAKAVKLVCRLYYHKDICTTKIYRRGAQHTQTQAHLGQRPLRWACGDPRVRALKGREARSVVQPGAHPPPTINSTPALLPCRHAQHRADRRPWAWRGSWQEPPVAGQAHSACGLLQLVHQGQGPSRVQNLSVCPTRTSSGCEEDEARS